MSNSAVSSFAASSSAAELPLVNTKVESPVNRPPSSAEGLDPSGINIVMSENVESLKAEARGLEEEISASNAYSASSVANSARMNVKRTALATLKDKIKLLESSSSSSSSKGAPAAKVVKSTTVKRYEDGQVITYDPTKNQWFVALDGAGGKIKDSYPTMTVKYKHLTEGDNITSKGTSYVSTIERPASVVNTVPTTRPRSDASATGKSATGKSEGGKSIKSKKSKKSKRRITQKKR